MNLYRSVKKQEGGGTVGTDVYIDGVKSSASRVDINSLIKLPYEFYNGSVVVYNNEIHILGGGGGGSDFSTKHYKWNGTTWSEVSTLPYDFYSGSAVVYNNEIYILSGALQEINLKNYKLDGNNWIELQDLYFSHPNDVGVIYEDSIVMVGGDATCPYIEKLGDSFKQVIVTS